MGQQRQTPQERRLLRRRERWPELIAEVVDNEPKLRHLTEEKTQAIIDGAEDVIVSVSFLGPVDDWAIQDMQMLLKPRLTRIVHDSDECTCDGRGRSYTGRRVSTHNKHAA